MYIKALDITLKHPEVYIAYGELLILLKNYE